MFSFSWAALFSGLLLLVILTNEWGITLGNKIELFPQIMQIKKPQIIADKIIHQRKSAD